MTHSDLFNEILADTRVLVEHAANKRRQSIRVSPEVAAGLEALGAVADVPVAEASIAEAPAAEPAAPVVAPVGDAATELAALAEQVKACTQCSLCDSRTNTVFSDGSATADLVFVGEAPGADEDRQGVPFVGRAGQLLTKIIEGGMKLKREEIYICNVLKCRPPNNRDPFVEEKRLCRNYLDRQLALVRPKVICALGGHAAKTLLETDLGTGKLRGRWHFYQGIPLRVTYHPSYLLHREQDGPDAVRSEKMKVWDDVQEVTKVLNGSLVPQADASSLTAP
jgi:DNA polymerase